MSAPLEELLKRVEESKKIYDEDRSWENNKIVTTKEIISAVEKSTDILTKRGTEDRKGDLDLWYSHNELTGFLEAIRLYMKEITITRENLYSLSQYLKFRIELLKKKKL
jgi:hypothetical protein